MSARTPDQLAHSHMVTGDQLAARVLRKYEPPPRLRLSEWMEAGNIFLPEGQSARPGKYRNWPYLVEPLDSMADPDVERVTFVKPTRVGFTKGLMGALAGMVATEPSAAILLVPRDEDARGYVVDEIEPLFDASPAISGLIRRGRADGRNTLLRKSFLGGASLKILAARTPANLRRHDAKVLLCDEVDGMVLTAEGDAIALAMERTRAHADRRIIMGSTPREEDTSVITAAYLASDQRVFEVACPHCQLRFEMLWEHVRYQDHEPERAYVLCPSENGCVIEERWKRQMVHAGKWRATRPDVRLPNGRQHRGYRLNSLVSLLANASWGILATEHLAARKGGPSLMQPFWNAVLGKAWPTSLGRVTSDDLEARAEGFGLDAIPTWVVGITVGTDMQGDRLESTVVGWPLVGAPSVLGHVAHEGSPLEPEVWRNYDAWLRSRWPHPNGWNIGIDAAAIDSGGSKGMTQKAYDFAASRGARNVFAIAGRAGDRPVWKRAQKVKGNFRLFIVGHDQVKTAVLSALGKSPFDEAGALVEPAAIRLSADLTPEWFDQATSEVRRVKYKHNFAVYSFEPKRPGIRHEALDCLCYAWAVRFSDQFKALNLAERAARRPDPATGRAVVKPRVSAADIAARLNG